VERSELFDDLSKQVVDALEQAVDELIVQLRQTFLRVSEPGGGVCDGYLPLGRFVSDAGAG
jgi:hypothetical protein